MTLYSTRRCWCSVNSGNRTEKNSHILCYSSTEWFWSTHEELLMNFRANSLQFSHSVVSDSLLPHDLQHARSPCPSPAPRVYSNSCPSSVMPSNHLIFCRPLLLPPSIFPSIRVFSNASALGGQIVGASASASVLPANSQG